MRLYNNIVSFTLLFLLLLLGFANVAFGGDYYLASYRWDFQNNSYFNFNQAMTFSNTPHKGVCEGNPVGYWNMDEGSGIITHDSSGNGNNGSIQGAGWVDGKYGKALNFDGVNNKVSIPNSRNLSVSGELYNGFTVLAWVKTNQADGAYRGIVSKGYSSPYGEFVLAINNGRIVCYFGGIGWKEYSSAINDGNWHLIGYYSNFTSGVGGIILDSQIKVTYIGVTRPVSNVLSTIFGSHTTYYNGVLDEVRIYNYALSASELKTLYQQPNPAAYIDYYNFVDAVTNNTLLIHVDGTNATSDNDILVTCTNFFADSKLVFCANNSVTVNLWTNLGQPIFTNSVWNSENYTTTLTLDASSTGELNWNTYNITTYVDAHSHVSPSNVTIGYKGSQTFSFNASQGYGLNVFVDGISQGQISSYTFSNVTANHAISVSSASLSSTNSSTPTPTPTANTTPTPAPTQSPGQTNSTSPTPTSQPETNQFLTQTAIALIVIVILIAGFDLAFKKGYLRIEIVDESPEKKEQGKN